MKWTQSRHVEKQADLPKQKVKTSFIIEMSSERDEFYGSIYHKAIRGQE